MKPFEFFFEGTPRSSDSTVYAGLKICTGEPVEIGLCLGQFASEAMKKQNDHAAAKVVVNAFKKFIELNPELSENILRTIAGDEPGTYTRIIKPGAAGFKLTAK